jgi:hypothetical protein
VREKFGIGCNLNTFKAIKEKRSSNYSTDGVDFVSFSSLPV